MVKLDQGALKAIEQRKSLLAVGVTEVVGEFEAGEVFQIADKDGVVQAVAKAKVDSIVLMKSDTKKNIALAHADDIVLL
jgi:glutamate 5-kinase